MTAGFVFFVWVVELFGFFLFGLDFSPKQEVRLYGLCEIKVPEFDFWEEGADNGEVAFGGFGFVDAAEVDLEPFDGQWKGGHHDLVVHEEVVVFLLVDIDFKAGELFLL